MVGYWGGFVRVRYWGLLWMVFGDGDSERVFRNEWTILARGS